MAFTLRSAYVCFFVGHLLAAFHVAERPASKPTLLPLALVVSGVACCVMADVWQPEWLVRLCYYQTYWLFPGQAPQMLQKSFGAILLLAGIINLQACRDALSNPWLVSHSRLSFPLYLVHWPIMCGLASAALVHLSRITGVGLAQFSAIALGIAASAAASFAFAAVDRYAVGVSRRLRRLTVGPPAIMPPAGAPDAASAALPGGADILAGGPCAHHRAATTV